MCDGIAGLGFTQKDAVATGLHYGMGSTTGLPRLAPNSLIFSNAGSHRTVGLLSTTLSQELLHVSNGVRMRAQQGM